VRAGGLRQKKIRGKRKIKFVTLEVNQIGGKHQQGGEKIKGGGVRGKRGKEGGKKTRTRECYTEKSDGKRAEPCGETRQWLKVGGPLSGRNFEKV